MKRGNVIIGDDSFAQYIRTVFIPEMNRIQQSCSGGSSGENKFCVHKQKLEYLAGLIETQGTEILTLIKDLFIYLSDWEEQYTPDIDKNSPSTLEFERKGNVFQLSLERILNQAIEVHYMFTREDKDGRHSDPKQFNQDSLDCLTSFIQKFSSSLIELIEYDVQKRTISVTLRNLLRNMKLLEHLQLLQTMDWYTLLNTIANTNLQPTSLLMARSSTRSKFRGRPSEIIIHYNNEYFNDFFSRVIDIDKLAEKDAELMTFLKNKEMRGVANVIKDLLTELRTGDEVQVGEALKIIEENTLRKYLTPEEVQKFFLLMLTELPDFEYVRLKSFNCCNNSDISISLLSLK